ncbi:hypothetical protein [Compostibacter hankyongensis]|uniref:Tetratricopeptide repeat protein n=1 Tax=Compostibacter hankyongensis TaxID=1007089 RepID=A0ABP8G463_9BACT
MPNQINEALFDLVNTLTKAEKRHFQLYLNKNRDKEDKLFIQLFHALEKMKVYDEKALFRKVPAIKKQQLSNLKAHLYKHLLTSLRLLYKEKDPAIELREQCDYARVLYDKGLYAQSLKMLSKIKLQARERQELILCHEIIEFEKLIESRHITRGLENRAEQLSLESRQLSRQLARISYLSNFSLQMYGLYLKIGHVRNEKDEQLLRHFFESNLPRRSAIDKMSLQEKLQLFQAFCWYYYALQDFLMYYRYAQKWVNLFETYPLLKESDPVLYIKAMHNLLTAHFYNSNRERFLQDLRTLQTYVEEHAHRFDDNMHITAFVYLYTAVINRHFLEGTFSEGLEVVPVITEKLESLHLNLDPHRVVVFYYKIACLYFGSGDNQSAIEYLNRIINMRIGNLHEDLQCFARILHLIAHYELENYSLVEYLVRSVYHFLARHRDLSQVIEAIMVFLRRNLYTDPRKLQGAFRALKDRLEKIAEDPYEKRSFLYLDIISWLESKVSGRPVQEVIREKYLKGVPRF